MANGKKFSALIVDHDSRSVANTTKYLSKNGFQVHNARNGQESLEFFLVGNTFDLVIMEMEMPIMDGFQATRELRAMGITSLIVGMSDESAPQTKIQEFIRAGLNGYHAKPMNMAKLAAIVGQFIN